MFNAILKIVQYFAYDTVKKIRISLLVAVLFNVLNVNLYAGEPVLLHDTPQSGSLLKHIDYYIDPSASADITEINDLYEKGEFQNLPSNIPTTIYCNEKVIWARFEVINKNSIPKKLYLHFPINKIEEAIIHQISSNKTIKKIPFHSNIPISKRQIKTRTPTAALTFEKGKTIVYVKIFSPTIVYIIDFQLLEDDELIINTIKDSAFYAGYFAIILIMLIYNLLIYLNIKDKSYYYYILYLVSFLISMLNAEGFLLYLGITSSFSFTAYFNNFTICLSIFFSNSFTIKFLDTQTNLPRIHKILRVINSFILVVPLISFINFPLFLNIYYSTLIPNTIISITAGILLYRKLTYARYYTHAYFIFFAALFALAINTIVFHQVPNIQTIEIGHLIEVIMLSFALARRFRDISEQNKKLSLVTQEIKIAEKFQRQLFPQEMPVSDAYKMAALYLPSAMISGDFYDYSKDRDGNRVVLISDVSGHGYSAGLIASMVKIAFHETTATAKDGIQQKIEMNRMLYRNLNNNFVTMATIRIFEKEKRIEYICCGHMPLIYFSDKEKTVTEIRPLGKPLGVSKDFSCEKEIINYQSGDRLLLYTDGLTEEMNEVGDMFGIKQLRKIIKENIHLDCQALSSHILRTLISWKKGESLEDDVTFVIVDLI